MKNQQGSKSFWKGKGFYLALTLVIAGAAMASFLAINSMMDKLGATPAPQGEEDIPWQDHTPAEEKQQNVPVPSSSSSQQQSTGLSEPSSLSSSSAQSAPAASHRAQAPSFVSPKAGQELQVFSGDELVFNETLKDWRTHNGLDIAGAVGELVCAPRDAKVSRVYEDPQWGGVVELSSDTLTMRLCGLSGLNVAEGDEVNQGDTIGTIGEAPAESALETHVHVEFIENGAYVDPSGYFS